VSALASRQDVVRARNVGWQRNPAIPGWVKPETVDLDRFFTRTEVAEDCYHNLLSVMRRDYARDGDYLWVDPSAGDGAFHDLLPAGRRMGIEIVPGRMDFHCGDYLEWQPPCRPEPIVVIGNPPFGYRAWLALAFLNHSAVFADYIGMILPMAFQSDGKGSPKFRVKGAELVETMYLPQDAFITDSGQPVQINALWQVWRRGVNNRKPVLTCNDWIDLFTVDMRKERLCGQERLAEADWFLQRTFYSQPPSLVTDFSEVRYVCGYGIVIHKEKRKITGCLESVDWRKYSNLAAHNCRHISMYHIRRALIDHGFIDP